LKDKETIQNLKNDIELLKEEVAGKKNKITDLEEKIKAVKPTPVLAPVTEKIVLKDGMFVSTSESNKTYIKANKPYEVRKASNFGNGYAFIILSEDGDEILCRLHDCSHLSGRDWTIVPAPEQVPNTLKEVELGAVAPLEAEVVPAPKPNVVGNVKRPYQKTGKFKKRK
jgi:hypothetical protein